MEKKFSAAIAGACMLLCLQASAAPVAKAGPADAQFKAIYTQEWKWRLSQKQEEGEDDDDSGVSSSLPRIDAATQARRPVGAGAHQLPGLQDADRGADRSTAVPRVRKAAERRYAFWSDMAYAARQSLTKAEAVPRLPAPAGRHAALLSTSRSRTCAPAWRAASRRRASRWPGRDAALASVAEAKTPQDTVFYTPFKSMPATIPAAEQANCARRRSRRSATRCSRPTPSVLAFVRERVLAEGARGAGRREPARRQGLLPVEDRRVHDHVDERRRDPPHRPGRDGEDPRRDAARDAAGRLQGDLPAFLQFLRTDPQFYAKTPGGTADARGLDRQEVRRQGRPVLRLPAAPRFAIVPVPDDQAPYYTSGRGGPGVYLVNTYNLPARALYSLPALTLHESAPGHAFQMPVALEQKGVPPFRRAYISALAKAGRCTASAWARRWASTRRPTRSSAC
jgi:hypothetical protein